MVFLSDRWFRLVLLGAGTFVLISCQSEDQTRRAPQTDTTEAVAPEETGGASAERSATDAAPEGMVYVPGGRTGIGIEAERWRSLREAREPGPRPLFGKDVHPPIWTEVAPFFLDVHPVTVAQFRSFVEDTGYTTQAEQYGNAGVLRGGQWRLVEGATWRRPRGPDQPSAPDDHPVTQVSWNDAEAYCEWADKRLPTEVEWEHAAREGKNVRALCPWDGDCKDRETRLESANTWQGRYPIKNTAADGYRYTSPVGAFGANGIGLQDMSGNVWEWTASWKRPYERRGTSFEPTDRSQRVQRGGSFICSECGGYYVFSRSSSTPNTSLFHVGFRCAKDASASADGSDPSASSSR